MSAPDTAHLLQELQEARAEADRYRKQVDELNDEIIRILALVMDNTRVSVCGDGYYPDWVINGLGFNGLKTLPPWLGRPACKGD